MFDIERATATGPRGGKVPGYCLAWRGSGFPPQGRGRRSGWYKFKADAIEARRVANEALRRDMARPERSAARTGSPSFVARLIDPAGRVHWYGHAGTTPDGLEAFRFTNAAAATTAARALFGHGAAFWDSERASQESLRREFAGWRFEAVADADLPRPTCDATGER